MPKQRKRGAKPQRGAQGAGLSKWNGAAGLLGRTQEKGREPMQPLLKTLRSRDFWLRQFLPFALAIAAAFIARYQLEVSDGVTPDYLAGQWPLYAPLNAFTAFCITLLLFALCGRWWLSTGISGVLFTVLAIANYYTRDLHGTALMPQDVLNITTAAAVMGSYTLRITSTVKTIALCLVPVAAIAAVQRWLSGPKKGKIGWPRRLGRWAGCAAGIFAILYVGYFAPFSIKPKQTYGWAWQTTYYTYGYLAGTIESAGLLMNPIVEPDYYSDEAAAEAAARAADYTPAVQTVSEQEYPDVVLILSESLYDFDLVTDTGADQDVLSVIKNTPNSIYGHTVSPHVGGGTNSSEYEMLTSNSLMLMPSITPFNWLNLYNANSIVSYLEDLGYATLAAHPYTNSNYRRNSAWLNLGFDEVHFQDDFPTKETYGNRPYQTDSATYRDFEALYEAMPADRPRFTFLVSIQSHGDYNMNDASLDLVHAATDYGEYDDLMDEYLSCIYMTDQAFGELTEYFTNLYEETGRKVIVALAGDHAPSFVTHVSDASVAPENDLQILQRSTPYVIWANYPLENAGETSANDPYNRIDMCMLAPVLAEQAGLPLTPYYSYMLAMREDVTVFTAGNDFMDASGVTHTYGENAAMDEWVHGYFALEYNNIGTHAHRNQALFTVTQGE